MAVTPTILSDINDLAKDYFSEVYQPQENTATALKAQFSRLENFIYTGRSAIFSTKLRNGGGAANAGANKSLPAATQGAYDQGTATIARTYVRMGVDLFALEVTKQQKGSYRPALAELMEDRTTAMDKEKNRQMFANGDGKLAGAGSSFTGAGTTQSLTLDYNVANGGNGVRHIVVGDVLQFYDGSNAAISTPRTITAVSRANQTVTFASSLTTNANSWVTRATSDTDNSLAGEALGLLSAMTQSGNFEGIPTGSGWLAKVNSNSGTLRSITDSLVMQTVAGVHAESGEWPDLCVTRPGVVLNYSEIFLPIRRINGQEVQLKGGYKPMGVLQTAGPDIPILEDLDAPNSRLFFLNTKYIKLIDLIGQNWADQDGAEFSRIPDKDGIEGYLRSYWGLAYTRLNALDMLSDITDVASLDRLSM